MHAHFSETQILPLEPHTIGLSCTNTPLLKSTTPPEPHATPRLRTSMSSHSRLMPDDMYNVQTASSFELLVQTAGGQSDSTVGLMDLPEEIHQRILDMLMGELRSTSSNATDSNHALRNWNHVMRHPRGRKLANLALVTPLWRRLIQERLYRHIKIQGTNEGIQECYRWFGRCTHLQPHVRHIEFWVPVWERRGGTRDLRDPSSSTPITSQPLLEHRDHMVDYRNAVNFSFVLGNGPATTIEPINSAYRLSSQKATLDELFYCVNLLFQSACVLTVEGGHCKKPPMIQHFRNTETTNTLTTLPCVRTLILRGSWNIMRDESHFKTISSALPNVREWHCSFTKPKSRAYFMMHSIFRQQIPATLTHLNICLEGFYSKKMINVGKMQVLQREHHLCEAIGHIMPQLEALTLTGRACSQLFTHAIDASMQVRKPKLKSLDLVVKNCCRGLDAWNDGTGIHNWSFIAAFEQLVTVSSRALKYYPDLNFLRIRFVDLDAPAPLLNPYFQLQNDELTGIWNDVILRNLEFSRPAAKYADISDCVGQVGKAYPGYPTLRPKSMRTSIYQAFAEGPFF